LTLVKQTDFDDDTLMPRWGCYVDSLFAMAQIHTGYAMNRERVHDLYWICRERSGYLGLPIVSVGKLKDGTPALWCNDHDALLLQALRLCRQDGYMNSNFVAMQTGDNNGWGSWVPDKYRRRNFTLCRKQTPNGGHWVLCDSMRNLLFDPHGGLAWVDTPVYLRFYIGGTG